MSMPSLKSLISRRVQICNEIARITTMRRGNFNEFYYEQELKNGATAKRGPFYNVTVKGEKGKTITKSVPKKDAEQVRGEVDNYRKFRELSDEYIDVCEKISLLSDSDDEAKKN